MLKTKIPPPLYMLLFALLMWLLHKHLPVTHWVSPTLQTFGWFAIAAGVAIDLSAMGLFLRAGTSPNPFQPGNASRLVLSGPYRFTRNPMYFGLLVLLTGWAILLGSLSSIALLPVFIAVITFFQIKPEELALETVFGDDYLAYKKHVRRWI